VCEQSDSASEPQPAATSATSAPVPAPQPIRAAQKSPAAAAWGANPSQAHKAADVPAPQAPPAPRGQQQGSNKPRAAGAGGAGGRSQPGMPRVVAGGQTNDSEFDIQAMLASFDKAFVMQEASGKVKDTIAYNKASSFFDTLDEGVRPTLIYRYLI